MRFKLDENFGTRTQNLFRREGHDVQTVRDQRLQGCSDQHRYELCCAEQRCLVTLDLDFADVTRFPPAQAGGIAVIRVPRNPSLALLEQMVRQLLQALSQMTVEKHLWIVEVGRIRIHQPEPEEDEAKQVPTRVKQIMLPMIHSGIRHRLEEHEEILSPLAAKSRLSQGRPSEARKG